MNKVRKAVALVVMAVGIKILARGLVLQSGREAAIEALDAMTSALDRVA